ncbi:MAG: hypothetical protein HQL27_01975 [Candidatus Omnitrophica bacterium]|nr:hypothetical protein [Candidatus Omnitrophota bacterium]
MEDLKSVTFRMFCNFGRPIPLRYPERSEGSIFKRFFPRLGGVRMTGVFLCFFFSIVLLATVSFAQEGVKESNIISPFPIKLEKINLPKDNRGTDTTNVYNIKVDFEGLEFKNDNQYTVVFFLDGQLLEVFKGVKLPYSFTRNFKGQNEGAHVIKIVVEDRSDNVLSEKQIEINVLKKK